MKTKNPIFLLGNRGYDCSLVACPSHVNQSNTVTFMTAQRFRKHNYGIALLPSFTENTNNRVKQTRLQRIGY